MYLLNEGDLLLSILFKPTPVKIFYKIEESIIQPCFIRKNAVVTLSICLPFFLITLNLVTSYFAKYHDAVAAAKPWLKRYA